jgi:type IV secretory pathway VirJ component
MRRTSWLAFAAAAVLAANALAGDEHVTFGRFGTVTIYQGAGQPAAVALFVSGDGGWNKGVVDMAHQLASTGALVVGIDMVHYLKQLSASNDGCLYPASDFEALSQFVQKRLDFPRYVEPVLIGYSSGATLVYATLAQAPPDTFAGAVSLGFCPDFPTTKPFCKGRGLGWERRPKGKGVNFLPTAHLTAPWIALQGTIDQVCDPAGTEAFVSQVPRGEIVVLPRVGHGFSVPRNWLPQFKRAFAEITREAANHEPQAPTAAAAASSPPSGREVIDVSDLPLIELPARGVPDDVLGVVVSGDGGWAGIDRELGEFMADQGIAVVGLNSLQYFWKKKNPEVAAADLRRILRHYLVAWKKSRILLVGYSRGAEVLPFMVNRLPEELRAKVRLVALLGPTPKVAFEFHVADWLGGSGEKDQLPVRPEIDKLAGTRILCFYGEEERDSLCPSLPSTLATVVALKGAHHFGGDYAGIARTILTVAGLLPGAGARQLPAGEGDTHGARLSPLGSNGEGQAAGRGVLRRRVPSVRGVAGLG